MTMLEKIANSRAWRGCKVQYDRKMQVYRLTHPSGAVAILQVKPARLETKEYRKWVAIRERELGPAWRR